MKRLASSHVVGQHCGAKVLFPRDEQNKHDSLHIKHYHRTYSNGRMVLWVMLMPAVNGGSAAGAGVSIWGRVGGVAVAVTVALAASGTASGGGVA